MNPIFSTLLVALLLFVSRPAVAAGPFLQSLFTDNMVLQRDVACPIWGWTDPGATVTVTVGTQAVTATAASDGRWEAKLAPHSAGGPETIMVAGPKTVTLKNVLFGDVWVASGQSNMDFGINGVDQWWNEMPASTDNVRLFAVATNSAFKPAETVSGAWVTATADNLRKRDQYDSGGYTAVGWFFARAVFRKTGIPIGIIESAQGNTAIQPWSTVDALRQSPKFWKTMDVFSDYEKNVTESFKASDPAYDETQAWCAPTFDDALWSSMDLPQDWSFGPLPGFNGVVWFRKHVTLPPNWADGEADVNLGYVFNSSVIWVNGKFVGGNDGYRNEHRATVPSSLLHAGDNVIVVRVQGDRGINGKADQMKLTPSAGDVVSLAGAWKYKASTPGAKLTGRRQQFPRIWTGAGLYQGMIAPLTHFPIKGVIWYQGEGNGGQSTYAVELSAMIKDWRAAWGEGDFPFYIVQLAGFGAIPDTPQKPDWALTRELQAKVARETPNSGLAVAIDRGEVYNIHPPNKRDVGNRLAVLALAKAYGLDVPCEGPTYKSMAVESGKIRIKLDHAAGLKSLGGAPGGFAIAGADQKFVWAQAMLDGESIIVWSPDVKDPVAVRYAYGNNTVCNVYNGADFPAVPFRTDIW